MACCEFLKVYQWVRRMVVGVGGGGGGGGGRAGGQLLYVTFYV